MGNIKKYLINNKNKFILEYYGGKFNVDELIAFKKQLAQDALYNPNFNIIHDFRDADFRFEFSDVQKYIDVLMNNHNLVGERKSVTITSTPNQVTTSFGFEMQKQNLPILFNITSTIEAAAHFIGIAKTEITLANEWFRMNHLKFNNIKNQT